MATHCLSGRGLLGCGWQEGFSRGDGGLRLTQEFVTGVFVSRVYDSGREGTDWDSLRLEITDGAAMEVFVWLFDEADETEEELLQAGQVRRWLLLQREHGKGRTCYGSNYRTMLLYGRGGGRYARLAVEVQPDRERSILFAGYDLAFPKESFTRYLPAIFRDDPVLERFLAVQQDIYLSLESEVDRLAEKMDFDLIRFWQMQKLARWMGWGELAKKETLGEELLRGLLREGISLTGRKGTCEYYIRLTELLTGQKAVMAEEPEIHRAVVLVLGEPGKGWEKCRNWLKKNVPLGIEMDFVVLGRTDRLDQQCFLDKTAWLSDYETALLKEGCPIERIRLQ